ncbi:phosphatidylinositol phosphate synthase [Nocardioides sp. AE5]|uniref:phosphatidylinositol phosphate synthase n=1 Tax=Nocardioides sp. AE5 TaxID=2962573 RepID=UPI0037C8687F
MLSNSVLDRFKGFWQGVLLAPFVNLFLKLGISPDTVTLVGTIGVVAGAVIFFPQGMLLTGVLVITAFVFSDLIDGQMARKLGRQSKFGAFWDSTLDRFGDAAIFGGLAMYYVGPGDNDWFAALAIYCLSMGSVTSYARARAQSLGLEAKVGIAERADRLVSILVITGVADLVNVLGAGEKALWAIPITLGVLALASTLTVVQRVVHVRRLALAEEGPR